jgi:NADPH-dependent F420 reductase
MRIAILGVGNVGGSLAAAAVRAGHDVVVSASSPDSARSAASSTGATAAASNVDAVKDADIVVLAVPPAAVADIAAELADTVAGKVVVDSTNPLNATYTDLTTSGTSAAETLQQQLPSSSVVKAFNTIFAARHANPTEGDTPLDALIAGDDADAKAAVGELAGSLGYRAIDAGGLRMARTLEEMAFLNISLNAGNGWAWQSAWKLVGPTESA